MKRGEIWWANLPILRGSEPGYRRPVVIVSDDRFNASSLRTVIVVSLTTNLHLEAQPGNVRILARGTGLTKTSVANITTITTVDRDDLDQKIGRLPHGALALIDAGLRLVLSLK